MAFTENFGGALNAAWTQHTGSWSTSGGHGVLTSTDGTAYDLMTVPSAADGTPSVEVPTLDSVAAGLVFRYSDASNFWVFVENGAGCELRKIQAGTPSTVGSDASTGALSVVLLDDAIDCRVGGVSKITTINTFNKTATRHGLAAEPSSGCAAQWDNFSAPDAPAASSSGGMFFAT